MPVTSSCSHGARIFVSFGLLVSFINQTNPGQTEPWQIYALIWHVYCRQINAAGNAPLDRVGWGKFSRADKLFSRQWVHCSCHVKDSRSKCGKSTVKGERVLPGPGGIYMGHYKIVNHLYKCLFCLSFGLTSSFPPHPHTETPCPLSVVSYDLANKDTYGSFRSASILFQRSQT